MVPKIVTWKKNKKGKVIGMGGISFRTVYFFIWMHLLIVICVPSKHISVVYIVRPCVPSSYTYSNTIPSTQLVEESITTASVTNNMPYKMERRARIVIRVLTNPLNLQFSSTVLIVIVLSFFCPFRSIFYNYCSS